MSGEKTGLMFGPDGWSECREYYIGISWSDRNGEDHYKAFYRPDASIEELTDWTWSWDDCLDACNTHANLKKTEQPK